MSMIVNNPRLKQEVVDKVAKEFKKGNYEIVDISYDQASLYSDESLFANYRQNVKAEAIITVDGYDVSITIEERKY